MMGQYRQSNIDRARTDHIAIGVRGHKRNRRLRTRRVSTGSAIVLFLVAIGFIVSVFVFLYLVTDTEVNDNDSKDEEMKNDSDFLANVTRTPMPKVVKFGHGSVSHGRDSRYWDKDDRRRDDDYGEDTMEHTHTHAKGSQAKGLYNEAGWHELKTYEAQYEASLKEFEDLNEERSSKTWHHSDEHIGNINGDDDLDDDEYDDGFYKEDSQPDEAGNGGDRNDDAFLDIARLNNVDQALDTGNVRQNIAEVDKSSLTSKNFDKINTSSKGRSVLDGQSAKKSTPEKHSVSKKKKRRSCNMKLLNSTGLLVEPLESKKFARFALQYTKFEEKPNGQDQWEPRFSGHQSLEERELSFFARDQKINCGFVKGPKKSGGTGFDLAEDDKKYMSSCHIAVLSCIFGNSDRLRTPSVKMVSRLSRKNVCFVMFVDEKTLQTLTHEGQMPDSMGFVGLWKIIVVKDLPFDDMRRVGKIPKFLAHRLFPSARYSIWLDSKLRLQLDPKLILEYFLWRKGHEYAISNHYDRHCLWEEVAQNKKLNKYNHSVIDEQFEFYQADGLQRFNASNPNKLLPSNVPEGSFIVRAHTPMSNLFSCLWFNEVDRFTPRDQLSFAYTYHKLRRTNPDKPFFLHMFKDCERRAIAKLFHHRSEERRIVAVDAVE